MSMISDLLDAFDEIKKVSKGAGTDFWNKIGDIFRKNSDIRKKASNSLLQFPVLISDGVESETLSLITNALEVDYATFVKLALGMEDVVDLDTDRPEEAKAEYLRRFHQNTNMGELDPGRLANDEIQDQMNERVNNYLKNNLEVLNKEQLKTFQEDLREDNLNDLTISDVRLMEKELLEDDNEDGDNEEEENSAIGVEKKLDYDDIRKNRDNQPAMIKMTVKYRLSDEDGGTTGMEETEILLAVKTVSHLIPSDEMVKNISQSVKENSLIFRAIQWTTGEIKFFKDFLLNLDRIKREVSRKDGGKRNSRWWYYLKNRAEYSQYKKALNKEEFLPNATMVITKEEAEQMKNNFAVDIKKSKVVNDIMETFFLLGFVVVDDINEVAMIWDESAQDWQRFTYSGLKANSDGRSKDDLKMLVDLTRNR